MIRTLFVGAHPDDVELMAAGPVAEHAAAGQDVHVLLLTRGEASGVRGILNGTGTSAWWGVTHDPAVEGYQPLSRTDLGIARIAEATTAVRCLAAGLPGTITVHEAGLPDGAVAQADAFDAILALCDEVAPNEPVRLKTHSWIVDDHLDHLAAGNAVRALRTADSARFGDIRFYIEPPYWADPRRSQVAEAWDYPNDDGIRWRVRNAIRAYGAWAPSVGSFAIGWHSVAETFAALDANPRSMVHP